MTGSTALNRLDSGNPVFPSQKPGFFLSPLEASVYEFRGLPATPAHLLGDDRRLQSGLYPLPAHHGGQSVAAPGSERLLGVQIEGVLVKFAAEAATP